MSNFRALGFEVQGREDLEELARLPLKAPGLRRGHETGAVMVHRLELGAGIELWTVQQGTRLVASYPTYMARGLRDTMVAGLSFPHTPFTPRVRVDEEPSVAFQLVNYLLVPPAALAVGTPVRVAVTALAAGGFTLAAPGSAAGLTPPPRSGRVVPDNVYHIVGEVCECEKLVNPRSGVEIRWLRLEVPRYGRLEAVAHGDDVPPDLAIGVVVEAVATLRGAIVQVPERVLRGEAAPRGELKSEEP